MEIAIFTLIRSGLPHNAPSHFLHLCESAKKAEGYANFGYKYVKNYRKQGHSLGVEGVGFDAPLGTSCATLSG